uniref:Uncharacterized protein n=1 Tax=Romanomermis culicivorax TaxID=13658 RepID=A0A915IG75_ROMCU
MPQYQGLETSPSPDMEAVSHVGDAFGQYDSNDVCKRIVAISNNIVDIGTVLTCLRRHVPQVKAKKARELIDEGWSQDT